MWPSLEILNVFNILALKQIFWKTKTLFKKLDFHVLVESSEIENSPYPYKTAPLKANVKTNKMGCRKWNYHKEQKLP